MAENNERLDFLVSEFEYAKGKINDMKKYQSEIEELLLKEFSEVTPGSDYEGVEKIKSEKKVLTFTHKLTRKVLVPEVEEFAKEKNLDIHKLFTVDLKYSATKSKSLTEDLKKELESFLEVKPAKTSITIKDVK